MAITPEKRVKDAVVKILKSRGVYYFFPVTGGYGRSGLPDIVACHRGIFVGIECKAGNNKPTALQLSELGKIIEAGGQAIWVSEGSLELVVEVLNLIEGEEK